LRLDLIFSAEHGVVEYPFRRRRLVARGIQRRLLFASASRLVTKSACAAVIFTTVKSAFAGA
jgi:hypothetical protein